MKCIARWFRRFRSSVTQTYMNDIIGAINNGLTLSSLGGGWPAYLWR